MGHLFMTGASGLLGGQLLARLLRDGRQVAVLVRPTAKASARERIHSLLAQEEKETGLLPRPIVIEGDLTKDFCGLRDADRDWVQQHCHSVLHNAASLEFVGADRQGEPWRTNLSGTRNLLKLTEQAGITEFHHVSTAYVCGLTPGPIAETSSTGAHGFRNDYEASKHEAETLIREASFLERPTFYRPAVIVGHSQTGATSTYHGLMAMLQLMTVIVRSLPEDENGFRKVPLRLAMTGDEQRNMVPVDWVADVMARLLAIPEVRGRTIHLAPKRPITIREIIDSTSSYLKSYGLEFCGTEKPEELNDIESFAYGGKGLYEAYEQTDPTFDTTTIAEFVPEFPCPIIDEQMIHRFLRYGDADRWGKRRRQDEKVSIWIGDLLESLSSEERITLVRAVAGGTTASPPSSIGLQVLGHGGGAWTIRRETSTSAVLEQGIDRALQLFRVTSAELVRTAQAIGVLRNGQAKPSKTTAAVSPDQDRDAQSLAAS